MDRRDRAALDHPHNRLALHIIELRGLTRRFAVKQAGSPPRIEPHHPETALGATLTPDWAHRLIAPDDVAIRRTGDSVKRLDAMVETMRRDGTLRVFNATKPDAQRRAPL